MTMLAYHGKKSVKDKYLSRVAKHRAADQLVQGIGASGSGKSFLGCAVGCTLNKYDHGAYETELGVPRVLAHLEDRIFEGLEPKLAMKWPSRFLSAIRVGADLSTVWPAFAHWMLVDETHGVIRHAKNDRTRDAIRMVANLFERQLAGGSVSSAEWNEARKTAAYAAAAAAAAYAYAYAAAYAADAAAAAAAAAAAYARLRSRRAHFEVMSDKLLDLLRAAPVRRAA
jgi:hypothetical protein